MKTNFIQKEKKISHEMVHQEKGEKNVICKHCSKTFHLERQLTCHMKYRHDNRVLVKCDFCEKEYSTNFSLQRHIKSFHLNGNNQTQITKC